MDVNILSFEFVIDNPLAGIEAGVTGEQIAQCTCQGVIQQALRAEQFYRKKSGGDRAVDSAAEDTDQTYRSCKACGKAKQGTGSAAETGTDKEARNNFTAFESGRESNSGEENLQQKCQGISLPQLDGLVNHRRTGSVIITGGEEQRENDEDCGTGENPKIRVREMLLHNVFHPVKNVTEEEGDKTAECGKNCYFQHHQKLQGWRNHLEMGWTEPKEGGNAISGQRCQKTGEQGSMIQKTDTDYCHGENGCSQWSPEKSGKKSCHPCERCSAQIPVIKVKKFAGFISNGPAHLQSGTFTSR